MSVVKPLLPPKPADKLLIKECFERLKDIGILSEKKSIELCESVNGVLNNETPTITDSMKVLHDLEYIYFNDDSLIEEIYKSMSNKNFCFLHEINLFIEESKIFIRQHMGYKNRKGIEFNPTTYYEKQIINCESDIFAIPIGFFMNFNSTDGHANMLIVKRIRDPITRVLQSIEVEHFEPHGARYRHNETETKKIGDMISILIHALFERERIPINIFTPEMICPRNNEGLQSMVSRSDWSGTCEIFSMWYAFKRLTEPEKDAKVVYEEMFKVFDNKNPIEIIKAITHSFVKLVNIDLDKNMINRRVLSPIKIEDIKLGRIIKQLEDKTYSSNEINISNAVENIYIIKLLNTLKTNETVRTLTISNNIIDNRSMYKIFDALQYNKTLENLYIAGNSITFNLPKIQKPDLLKIFINLSLKKLDLSNNNIGDKGLNVLATVLKVNKSIIDLNLSNNNIGDKGASEIAEALKQTKSIDTIDLSNNNIGYIGASKIVESLRQNRTLEHIILYNNHMTYSTLFKLNKELGNQWSRIHIDKLVKPPLPIKPSSIQSRLKAKIPSISPSIKYNKSSYEKKYIKYKIKYHALRDTLTNSREVKNL
jgi:hypothetical protein